MHLRNWAIIGASLSKPHIDEFAVEFLCIIYFSYVVLQVTSGSYFARSCVIR